MAENPIAIQALTAQIKSCRLCAEHFAATPSAHAPRPVLRVSSTARICIAGQAPGTRVHATGVPFNDPSGRRLRAWMGVDDAQFYDASQIAIIPMAFCFPGRNAKGADLPPPKICAKQWRGPLFKELEQFELILLVGAYAQAWHLGQRRRATLTQTVKAWREFLAPQTGPALFPTPHPSWRNNAWLRKNPWFEAEALPRLRAEIARLLSLTSRRPSAHAKANQALKPSSPPESEK